MKTFMHFKDGQTYFKNLAMFNTPRLLKHAWTFFNIIHERFIEHLIIYLPFKDKNFIFCFLFPILFNPILFSLIKII